MRRLIYTNPAGEQITLDKSPYLITKLEGTGPAQIELQSIKAPYQDGAQFVDGIYGTRTITVECAIIAPNDTYQMNRHKRLITKAFRRIYTDGELSAGVLRYENDYGAYEIDAVPSALTFADRGQSSYQAFQVMFDCPNPFWRAADARTNILLSYETGGVVYPLAVPDGGIVFSVLNNKRTVKCVSDVVTPVLITFNGPAVNPIISNNTTGLRIKVGRALGEGDKLIINTDPNNKYVKLNDASAYNYITPDTVLWQLQPGDNELQYSSDDNNPYASVVISFIPLFTGA